MHDDEFPFARRTIGAALITGASGAGLALSMARPMVNESIELAYLAAEEVRRASRDGVRTGARAALEAGGPAIKSALEAKDRLRRRAIGSLPPTVGGALEEWRRQFIDGEKAVYFGSLRLADEMQPTFEVARGRSRDLLKDAVKAFEDVADAALATTIKFGEEIQGGEIRPPHGPKPKAAPGSRAAARKKTAKRRP